MASCPHPSPSVPPVREDLDDLVALSLAARAESMVGAQLCTDDADRLRHQIGALVGEPGALGLVGMMDGEVCGLVLARIQGPSLFTDEVAVSLEAVYVAEGARRRGVGHALLGAVLEEAQRVGATDVLAMPLPGARGMLRFLARLGFAPAAAHRVVSTEALQRRLVADAPARRPSGRIGIDDLIARRRRARAGRAIGGPEGAAVQPAQAGRASISMQVSRAEQTRRPRGSSTTTS